MSAVLPIGNEMIAQRWRARRATYRPAGEPIRTEAYDVAAIPGDAVAREFVEAHHYSSSYPAARARFGLYRRGELVGVAVLSQPPSQAALDKALDFGGGEGRAELGRFVLLDDVPANGESWFLARAFEIARRDGFTAIVSHSDPEPRRNAAGELIFAGHIGTIYQSTNARYLGKTNPHTERLLPDGSVLSPRALSKIRKREKGWRYVVELLVSHGAAAPAGDWDAWRRAAVEHVTRPVRHHGNHRYVWAIDRRLRRSAPAGLPYPKFTIQIA